MHLFLFMEPELFLFKRNFWRDLKVGTRPTEDSLPQPASSLI